MVLIGLKQPIHPWTRRFTSQDVRSVLQFVAITGVILPLVPNKSYGPFDALNPWSTWLMVVLISGLGSPALRRWIFIVLGVSAVVGGATLLFVE